MAENQTKQRINWRPGRGEGQAATCVEAGRKGQVPGQHSRENEGRRGSVKRAGEIRTPENTTLSGEGYTTAVMLVKHL